MPPPRSTSVPTQPPANQPLTIVRGKPVVSEFPTPNISDRVFRIRKDSRVDSYKLPAPGDKYEGKYAEVLEDFVFATAKPADEAGQVDWFYVNRRLNQNAYNFEIDYPYVDRDYPRITRTYVVFRSDIAATKEPQADTTDPIFELLVLTDHQLQRLQDPIIDSVFVQVKRTFERLPSPIITTYAENQFQQRVTTRAQEVVKSDPPRLSATVEEAKQERTGTAKAKNTVSTVPRVFPGTTLTEEIPSIIREEYMGGFTERQSMQRVAGEAQTPNLGVGEITKTEKQDTDFIKTITRHYQDLPQVRNNQELTGELGGGVLDEEIKIDTPSSSLAIEEGFLVTESKLRNLTPFGKIRTTKRIPEWPILFETETDPKLGIVVHMRKSIVPAGTIYPPGVGVGVDEKFVDIKPADKWRSVQIVSKIDPNSLPDDVQWPVVEHLNLPPIITSLGPAWTDVQSSEAAGDLHGVAVGTDGSGSMHLKTHTRTKNRSTIARAFSTSSGRNHIAVGANFEIGTTHPIFGYTPAIVTRMIRFGPPPLDIVSPLAFKPVSGTASIVERSFEEQEVDGQDANSIKSATNLDAKMHAFGPVLVGTDAFGKSLSTTDKANTTEKIINGTNRQDTRQITNGVLIYRHYYPNVDVYRGLSSSGPAIESSTANSIFPFRATTIDSSVVSSKGVVSEVRILLPPSAPITLVTGQLIVVKVEVEVWRLNVYVIYVTSVIIP